MSGFQTEGLKIRYREKSINETSTYSNQLENTIDIKEEPTIFLRRDGKLYIKDNTGLEPTPISKFGKPFNSITLEDGILVFNKSDGTESVTLSDLTSNKASIIRDNSLVFSKTKNIPISEINILDQLRSLYFEENGTEGVNISASNIQYSNIQSEMDSFKATFLDMLKNTTLRSSQISVLDTYKNNYVDGITTLSSSVEISGSHPISGSPSQFYKTYEFQGGETLASFPQTLQPMSYYLNDTDIGFDVDFSDKPSMEVFAGRKLKDFKDFLYTNLEKYDGTYSYLSAVFDSLGYTGTTFSVSTSGEDISGSIIGEYDNGYTTIDPISGSVLYDPLAIDAQGAFSGLTYSSTLQRKFLVDVSKAMSTKLFDYILDESELYLRANSVLDAGTDDDDAFYTTYNAPVDISALVSYLDTQVSSLSDNYFDTEINDALDDAYTTYIGYRSVEYGGITNTDNALTTPIENLNEQWFDMPNMYINTNKIDNKKAVSCTSNFNIEVSESEHPITIAFRLYESVGEEVLDVVRYTTRTPIPTSSIGSYGENRKHIVPIEMNYSGPITQYTCNVSIDELIDSSDLNVGEHLRLRTESNCAGQLCIDDDGTILKQMVDELFTGAEVDIIKQNESRINVPRVFKVQWRVIVPTDIEVPQIADFDVFKVVDSGLDQATEATMGLSIFSVGDTTAKRSILKGDKQLKNANAIQVLFDTPMPNSDYSVTLTKDQNVKLWYDNKTLNGFTIRAERKMTCNIDWTASFQPQISSLQADTSLPECFVDNAEQLGQKTNFDILKQEGFLQ